MTFYVETYIIRGSKYGIEDYDDGRPADDHFFPNEKGRKRFQAWHDGCGIGQFDTLLAARQKIIDHVVDRARDDLEAAQRTVGECEVVLEAFAPRASRLDAFKA